MDDRFIFSVNLSAYGRFFATRERARDIFEKNPNINCVNFDKIENVSVSFVAELFLLIATQRQLKDSRNVPERLVDTIERAYNQAIRWWLETWIPRMRWNFNLDPENQLSFLVKHRSGFAIMDEDSDMQLVHNMKGV